MRNTTTTTEPQKQWLTPKELETEYSFGLKTQDRLRWQKLIPYAKVGRQVRYNRAKIDAWLHEHEVNFTRIYDNAK